MPRENPTRVLIIGAAGRDFHDFNVCFRNSTRHRVVCFTAAQIPDIDGRTYPPELAGPHYPEGIPIHAEEDLERLIREHSIDECTMSYSDLAHVEVMHKAALCNAAGADFRMLAARRTMLESSRPVIGVCAVRTGSGKSQTSRRVASILKGMGKKVAVVRHPMPYGDLVKQACQRFGEYADLDRHECTIEEREEYEPHLALGHVVFAGVDYERILRQAEKEADVVLWDGGNNDTAFYRPNLTFVIADPHRAGHERLYFPGETNVRLADVVLINKVDTAKPADVAAVEASVRSINPGARILRAESPVSVERPGEVKGRRVLVVEDGPTLTHGEMKYGAGFIAAQKYGAAEVIDPRPFAVGSLKATFEKYKHLEQILPAMGYGDEQMAELQATINASDADLVLIGTPIDLSRLLQIDKPTLRVRYELGEAAAAEVEQEIRAVLA